MDRDNAVEILGHAYQHVYDEASGRSVDAIGPDVRMLPTATQAALGIIQAAALAVCDELAG